MIRRHDTGTRLAARLGLFAVLFQAILFGWHHHDLVFTGRAPLPPMLASHSTATQPVDDEDGCDICQVLHHQTAAASNGAAPPLPGVMARLSAAAEPVFIGRSPALAFHARAPPLV